MSPRSPGFSLGQRNITKGAFYLLIVEAGLSLVYLLSNLEIRFEMMRWLTANSYQVWHEFKLWTLVTSALLHDQLISLFFHGIILWLFVPVLERWWGTKKFLLFALWTSLAGTVTGTLLGLVLGDMEPVSGLDPFIYGSIVAYGVLYARQQVQFFGVLPLTGRQLMFGAIVIVALLVVLGGRWVNGGAYAAAMVLAWLMTSGKWTPQLWYLRWKHKRLRKKFRIVRDEDEQKWIN